MTLETDPAALEPITILLPQDPKDEDSKHVYLTLVFIMLCI